MITLKNETAALAMEEAHLPLLVKFHSRRCGPCLKAASIFKQWEARHWEKILFAQCDTDECLAFTRLNNIDGVPTFILFSASKEVKKWVGLPREDEVIQEVEKLQNE